MTARLIGLLEWGVERDKKGHRNFFVEWFLETDDFNDGPQIVLDCVDLPAVGSEWDFGNDYEPWAFCTPDATATMVVKREKNYWWTVRQRFTTEPSNRCQDTPIEDPLSEPIDISGSYTFGKRIQIIDKDGDPILTTSHELFPEDVHQMDDPSPTVKIGMNTLSADIEIFNPMMNTVNDAPLWGLPARYWRLAQVSFTRKIYGSCNYYWRKELEFEAKPNGWDRVEPSSGNRSFDEDTLLLDPEGLDPDTGEAFYKNPFWFTQNTDLNGGPIGRQLLDEFGRLLPFGDDPYMITVQKHYESNFFLLDIPVDLEAGI